VDDTVTLATGPGSNGVGDHIPAPPRSHVRTMMPTSWIGSPIRLEYRDSDGRGQKTSGTLLDWSPFGVLLNLAGTRTLISWDHIALLELSE
jgi:hypothetical protein